MIDRPKYGPMFINRENAAAVIVDQVNDSYATVRVLGELPSHWSMPVAEYDATFVTRYRPLDTGAMTVPAKFRMPANWAYWDEETAALVAGAAPAPASDIDPDRGESEQGVSIGAAGGSIYGGVSV